MWLSLKRSFLGLSLFLFFPVSIDIHMGLNSESLGLDVCSNVYNLYFVGNNWSNRPKEKERQYFVQWDVNSRNDWISMKSIRGQNCIRIGSLFALKFHFQSLKRSCTVLLHDTYSFLNPHWMAHNDIELQFDGVRCRILTRGVPALIHIPICNTQHNLKNKISL